MMQTEENYRDSFEQLLKETADRFSMQPSVRIWFSIYNNLHPSRKWPSPVSWLLISLFLLLLDTTTGFKKSGDVTVAAIVSKTENANSTGRAGIDSDREAEINLYFETGEDDISFTSERHAQRRTGGSRIAISAVQENQNGAESNYIPSEKTNLLAVLNRQKSRVKAAGFSIKRAEYIPEPSFLISERSSSVKTENSGNSSRIAVRENSDVGKFGYEIYATPSIGFRGFPRNSEIRQEVGMNSSEDISSEGDGKPVCLPSFNLEAGGSISYALSGIMRFKAGLQLNYSKYNLAAGDAEQIPAALLSGYEFASGRKSNREAANPGESDSRILSGRSYQVSLPLGADVKLAEAENIEWFAGASLQPTLLLPVSASTTSNESTYSSDEGLMRNWNINGGIETFISYHAGRGIRLNAGPQLRYQILSGYKSLYNYNDKLYNLGIKLGISSRF